ncbi:MAG: hypothetical protein KDD53_05450, partial [Bdellovibrionales bacterium]|nr:hypothetical protein [Bdellovibrionales bacterium]
MKCPNCQFVCSDLRDICPSCTLDLRPQKKLVNLPISSPNASYEELVQKLFRPDSARKRKKKVRSKNTEVSTEKEKRPSVFKGLAQSALSFLKPKPLSEEEKVLEVKSESKDLAPQEVAANENPLDQEIYANKVEAESPLTTDKETGSPSEGISLFDAIAALDESIEEQEDLGAAEASLARISDDDFNSDEVKQESPPEDEPIVEDPFEVQGDPPAASKGTGPQVLDLSDLDDLEGELDAILGGSEEIEVEAVVDEEKRAKKRENETFVFEFSDEDEDEPEDESEIESSSEEDLFGSDEVSEVEEEFELEFDANEVLESKESELEKKTELDELADTPEANDKGIFSRLFKGKASKSKEISADNPLSQLLNSDESSSEEDLVGEKEVIHTTDHFEPSAEVVEGANDGDVGEQLIFGQVGQEESFEDQSEASVSPGASDIEAIFEEETSSEEVVEPEVHEAITQDECEIFFIDSSDAVSESDATLDSKEVGLESEVVAAEDSSKVEANLATSAPKRGLFTSLFSKKVEKECEESALEEIKEVLESETIEKQEDPFESDLENTDLCEANSEELELKVEDLTESIVDTPETEVTPSEPRRGLFGGLFSRSSKLEEYNEASTDNEIEILDLEEGVEEIGAESLIEPEGQSETDSSKLEVEIEEDTALTAESEQESVAENAPELPNKVGIFAGLFSKKAKLQEGIEQEQEVDELEELQVIDSQDCSSDNTSDLSDEIDEEIEVDTEELLVEDSSQQTEPEVSLAPVETLTKPSLFARLFSGKKSKEEVADLAGEKVEEVDTLESQLEIDSATEAASEELPYTFEPAQVDGGEEVSNLNQIESASEDSISVEEEGSEDQVLSEENESTNEIKESLDSESDEELGEDELSIVAATLMADSLEEKESAQETETEILFDDDIDIVIGEEIGGVQDQDEEDYGDWEGGSIIKDPLSESPAYFTESAFVGQGVEREITQNKGGEREISLSYLAST